MDTKFAAVCLAVVLEGIAPASAQPIQGKIVDHQGVELGAIWGGSVYVRTDDGGAFLVPLRPTIVVGKNGRTWLDPTRLLPSSGPANVFFAEADCTGTAYIGATGSGAPGALNSAAVVDADGTKATIYIGAIAFALHRKHASSLQDGFVCINQTFRATTVPVAKVVDLSALYSIPLSLK